MVWGDRDMGLRATTRSAKETALLNRFESFYDKARSPVMEAIERSVCGCDYGGNSWTTRAQAEQMAQHLRLRAGMRLLELGAGAGWPGLYLAQATGCDVALVDIPLNGLRIAAERAASEGLARGVTVVAADAAVLPFPDAGFNAVSHSDLLCCLDQKRSVLADCRRVIHAHGRMAFTVISVVPGLSATAYRRAVANGPDFVESEADYPTLLAETGWTVSGQDDITSDYVASCRRQIDADEAQQDGLVALIGAEAFAERLAKWTSHLAALNDNLLRRDAFVAVPRPG